MKVALFEEIELYESLKRFVLLPRLKAPKAAQLIKPVQHDFDNVLTIDRTSNQIAKLSLSDEQSKIRTFAKLKSMTRIFGLVGIIELLSGI